MGYCTPYPWTLGQGFGVGVRVGLLIPQGLPLPIPNYNHMQWSLQNGKFLIATIVIILTLMKVQLSNTMSMSFSDESFMSEVMKAFSKC